MSAVRYSRSGAETASAAGCGKATSSAGSGSASWIAASDPQWAYAASRTMTRLN